MGMDVFGRGEKMPELDAFLASINASEFEDEVFYPPEEDPNCQGSSQASGPADTLESSEVSGSHEPSQASGASDTPESSHESAQAAGVSEAPVVEETPCCSYFSGLYNFFCGRS